MVIGGSGYLGAELVRQAADAGHEVTASYASSPGPVGHVQWCRVDVRDRAALLATVESVSPDVICNAAYRYDDWPTTAQGAGHVAAAGASAGARLLHMSSDAVFSGAARSYDEDALPDPITPYGAAKAAAETVVRGIDPQSTIVRTSLIMGDDCRSPHERIVHDLAAGRRTGVLFTDEVRCPIHVADLASALLELATVQSPGMHNVAGADALSRYEIGCLVALRDGLDVSKLSPGTAASRSPARPLDVRLDCRRTQAGLTTRLRGAREFIRGKPPPRT